MRKLGGNATREMEQEIAEHWQNNVVFRVLPFSELRMCSLTYEEGDIPLESYKGKTDDSALYEVDFIIDERRHGNTRSFRVKWKVRPLSGTNGCSPDPAPGGLPVLDRWRSIVQKSVWQRHGGVREIPGVISAATMLCMHEAPLVFMVMR